MKEMGISHAHTPQLEALQAPSTKPLQERQRRSLIQPKECLPRVESRRSCYLGRGCLGRNEGSVRHRRSGHTEATRFGVAFVRGVYPGEALLRRATPGLYEETALRFFKALDR